MEKSLRIKKIDEQNVNAKDIHQTLDHYAVEWNPIGYNNWAADYPYQPEVAFRIAHNGRRIFLEYRVREETVRAMAARNNGRPWEDSCCEFFFQPKTDGTYYNMECNCRGALLVACGRGREARVQAPIDIVNAVDRWSSLGEGQLEEQSAPEVWTLTLVIPTTLFFQDKGLSLNHLQAKGNFYKCGDKLPKPHFLSWNAIHTKAPDFHQPEAFGTLSFE